MQSTAKHLNPEQRRRTVIWLVLFFFFQFLSFKADWSVNFESDASARKVPFHFHLHCCLSPWRERWGKHQKWKLPKQVIFQIICMFRLYSASLYKAFKQRKKQLTIKTGLAIDSLRSCNSNVKENINSKSNCVLLQVFWDYSIPRPLLNITGEAKSPQAGALISINSWG